MEKDNKSWWIVADMEEGIICITNDYDEALEEYEKCKASDEEYVNANGEFDGNEDIILAKINKRHYSQVVEFNEESGEEHWDFKEVSYDTDSDFEIKEEK